ncbi:MAG: amidohydrolase [Rhodothermales bacterium]
MHFKVKILTVLLLFIALGNWRCVNQSASTGIAYLNAAVWTGNPQQPMAEALYIKDGLLVDVGTTEAISSLTGPEDQIIDVEGAFITPGFIDSHVHFITGGFRLASVQLRDANTPTLFTERIAEFAQSIKPGEWIRGGDWDHELWGGELPTRAWIDAVSPDNPVWVSRLDGHMALANTKALELAGVTSETEQVFGGTIVQDNNGEPTGIFKDNAMDLVFEVMPSDTESQEDRALAAAMKYVNAQGVTSVHHVGTFDQLDAFERARDANRLTTRIYAAVHLGAWQQLQDHIALEGPGDTWLKTGGLKGFVDGSLGSHTAAFFEPFTDAPADSGFFVATEETLYDLVSNSDKALLQPMIHAIGDRAINTILNIYERVQTENGARDRRFRIEHAQHIAPADIERFTQLGVIASMQPYHAIDDGRWAERVIGPERIKTTYAFKSLLDAGTHVAFGSDWFVAPPTPLEGIYAAVTRRTLDDINPQGWVPQQKITVEQALRAYTMGAAYASFEEDIKGSLEAGKLADFVVIDQNLLEIPSEKIRDARVLKTVVGGAPVFSLE